jgi:ATP/maltotriose-dependent transcriptional regulator MalT
MTQPSYDVEARVYDVMATLNARDLQVLGCLAEGGSTARIASALSVSRNTARTRIRRVQGKFDVTDRAAAVRAARELGVLGSSLICSGC